MKKLIAIIVCFCVVALAVVSCVEEFRERPTGPGNKRLDVGEAKRFFDDNVKNVSVLNTGGETRSGSARRSDYSASPDWKNAVASDSERRNAVEVPLKTKEVFYTRRMVVEERGSVRPEVSKLHSLLVVGRDDFGRTMTCVASIIPNRNYLKNNPSFDPSELRPDMRDTGFSGVVVLSDTDGAMMGGVVYEAGEIRGWFAPPGTEVAEGAEILGRFDIEVFSAESFGSVASYTRSSENGDSTCSKCKEPLIGGKGCECKPHEVGNVVVTATPPPSIPPYWFYYLYFYNGGSGGGNSGGYYYGGGGGGGGNNPKPNEPPAIKPDVSLKNTSHFSGYDKNDPAGCLRRCGETLTNNGQTNHGSSQNVFQLVVEQGTGLDWKLVPQGNNPAQNYKNAVDCIDRHLDANKLIIVGVNHSPGSGNGDKTTDHFVVIYSREYNSTTQNYEYLYYENGRSGQKEGCSSDRRLIYDPSIPEFYDPSAAIKDGARFDVTQVRPNDGTTRATFQLYMNQNFLP